MRLDTSNSGPSHSHDVSHSDSKSSPGYTPPTSHAPTTSIRPAARYFRLLIISAAASLALYISYSMLAQRVLIMCAVGGGAGGLALAAPNRTDCTVVMAPPGDGDALASASASDVPQYFRTTPELWAGPTATGRAPFLAQTNPVFFGARETFVPNSPLEMDEPIAGQKEKDGSIFGLMGYLSPYKPNPVGFGVEEFPLPKGAEIVQVQMLSRHGSRYPTIGSNVAAFGDKIAKYAGKFTATGDFSFLNDWTYELGQETLVPRGRQELFESGVLHYYMYGKLYDPKTKIIVRTTTQDRMLKSCENWLAGFFGLDWRLNATIEVIIESHGFNNSLAGYDNCPNSNGARNNGGIEATNRWKNIYLQDATKRLAALVPDLEWTLEDTYAAQTMCPYETVAYGYSAFCSLFTYEEWEGHAYSTDLYFAGMSAFQSPTGRAVGIGWVQESLARLEGHTLGSYAESQVNLMLDGQETTFPLNQSLYFDFSHDTNIMSILTAFGLTQFAELLPADRHPGVHNLTVAHMEPFGARLDIEVIRSPAPVDPLRKSSSSSSSSSSSDSSTKETKYIHFLLNQRTVPLGVSFPECGNRVDGWCELEAFLDVQRRKTKEAEYPWACFGDWKATKYGEVGDGVPVQKEKVKGS